MVLFNSFQVENHGNWNWPELEKSELTGERNFIAIGVFRVKR